MGTPLEELTDAQLDQVAGGATGAAYRPGDLAYDLQEACYDAWFFNFLANLE
jgi:hypothetical protein